MTWTTKKVYPLSIDLLRRAPDLNSSRLGTQRSQWELEPSVTVKGKLTIHGETKEVETPGKLTVQGGKINANASFSILLSDYKVSIPGLVADKVSKTAKLIISCSLEPLKS